VKGIFIFNAGRRAQGAGQNKDAKKSQVTNDKARKFTDAFPSLESLPRLQAGGKGWVFEEYIF
jgi:hypothetical protein